ncbi:MAG: NADPH-dependent F420 reductase [Myxococcota bacterium]
MRISILGAGRVGGSLGAGWAAAGHDVTFGVRDPNDEKQGALAGPTATVRDAVAAADLVVLATPWAAVQSVLEAAGDFAGKTLVDATNPIGPGFALTHGHDDSGAEQVARWATNANVVKSFNTTGFENMRNPAYPGGASVMFACGDDAEATKRVCGLASDLGFDPVNMGPLSRARELEPFAMVWIRMAMQLGHGRDFAFVKLRRASTS